MKKSFPISLNTLVLGLSTVLLMASPTTILAQSAAQPATAPQAAAADASELPLVEAEVRRVDVTAGKVTLKHAEIPNLEMPPMTMVFQVREPKMLEGVKPGDLVQVTLEKVNGAYTVRSLQRAPKS